jgi:hypothetical protein
MAEKYAMDGSYQAAIEQLQIARKAGDGDFYTLSEVDARLHQLQLQFKEEKQDNRGCRTDRFHRPCHRPGRRGSGESLTRLPAFCHKPSRLGNSASVTGLDVDVAPS